MIHEGQEELPNFKRAGLTYDEELIKCKRYYEKSYDIDTTPGTLIATGAIAGQMTCIDANQTYGYSIFFEVEKRASPSPETYNTTAATNNWNWFGDASSGALPMASTIGGTKTMALRITSGLIGCARGETVYVTGHWIADAEL